MKRHDDFFTEIYHYLHLRRLVMVRKSMSVPEAERWMGKWSDIRDPEEKLKAWETEIGPLDELSRVKNGADRAAGILAGNFQPILERGIVPLPPPPQAVAKSPKTKVPQSYLDLIFATERTIRKHQADRRAKNDLVKAEQIETLLDGGFEGVRLNVTEQRIIHGIFNCLGDPAVAAKDGTIRLNGFSELHAAMGLERNRTKRGKQEFDGREVDHVNKAFWKLARKMQPLVYKKETTPPGSQEPLYDVFVTQAPLYQVGYLFKDVTGKKLRYVAATARRPKGSVQPHKIVIKPHPALVAEYQRYFRLLPRDPYHEIRGLLPHGQYVQTHQLNFISWLHRHRPGKTVIETNKRSLAEEIGLGYLVQGGRWKELQKVLSANYRIAKRLGYLTDYQQNVPNQSGGVKDVLTLNPAIVVHANPKGLSNRT